MKLIKPKFWDKKYNFFSIVLLPFTFVVLIFIFFKNRFTKSIKFDIPIICVGNIYVGGTGKTPTSIFIAKELKRLGKKPVIIRKFYKNHIDEHDLIKRNFADLIVDKNRVDAIKKAEKLGFNIAILDDGFQDRKINKDFNIICFNQNQLIGNGLVLPAGPLRESLNSLKNAHLVLINGEKDELFEKKILNINKNLHIVYSNYSPKNLNKFRNKKLLAFAGIGNPKNFFKLLEENNLMVEKKIVFPDHYQFTIEEFQNIVLEAKKKKLKIIMTEKDFFKTKNFDVEKNDYLEVTLEIKNLSYFMNLIKQF